MKNKVKEIQEYLHTRGYAVSETAIVDAAITIAIREGGIEAFAREFWERKR